MRSLGMFMLSVFLTVWSPTVGLSDEATPESTGSAPQWGQTENEAAEDDRGEANRSIPLVDDEDESASTAEQPSETEGTEGTDEQDETAAGQEREDADETARSEESQERSVDSWAESVEEFEQRLTAIEQTLATLDEVVNERGDEAPEGTADLLNDLEVEAESIREQIAQASDAARAERERQEAELRRSLARVESRVEELEAAM
jgi:hypothetical protein